MVSANNDLTIQETRLIENEESHPCCKRCLWVLSEVPEVLPHLTNKAGSKLLALYPLKILLF